MSFETRTWATVRSRCQSGTGRTPAAGCGPPGWDAGRGQNRGMPARPRGCSRKKGHSLLQSWGQKKTGIWHQSGTGSHLWTVNQTIIKLVNELSLNIGTCNIFTSPIGKCRRLHDCWINPKTTHLTRPLHSLNNQGELLRVFGGYLIVKCCCGLCLTRKAPLILTETETKEEKWMWSLRTGTCHKDWLHDA